MFSGLDAIVVRIRPKLRSKKHSERERLLPLLFGWHTFLDATFASEWCQSFGKGALFQLLFSGNILIEAITYSLSMAGRASVS